MDGEIQFSRQRKHSDPAEQLEWFNRGKSCVRIVILQRCIENMTHVVWLYENM